MLPKWFAPVTIAVVAGLSIWLLSVQAPKKPRLIIINKSVPDTFMENFTTYIMDEQGKPKHEIHASHMAHYPYDDHSEFTSPRYTFYQPNDHQWDITAKKGLTKNGAAEIVLLGDVIIRRRQTSTGGSNIQITTSKFLIRPDDSYGETDQKITVTDGEHRLQSKGIKAYFDEGRVELLSQVRGVYVL